MLGQEAEDPVNFLGRPRAELARAGEPPAEPTECAETLAAWPGPLRTVPVPPAQKRGCTSKTVAELPEVDILNWPKGRTF